MKFSTTLLTLLASTSVLSYNIKRQITDEEIESLKSMPKATNAPDVSNFDLSQISSLDLSFLGIEKNEECNNALKGYSECLVGIDENKQNNKDNLCTIYNSEKCQSLYKNGVKSVKGCENLQDILLRIEGLLIETNSVSLKMQCAKDENGKYCPLSDLSSQLITEVNNKSSNSTTTEADTQKKFDEAVNATCKSRTCIDAALEFETGTNKIKSDIEEFKKQIEGFINFIGAANDMPMFIPQAKYAFNSEGVNDDILFNKTAEYLKSNECSAQAPKKQESSATTLKFGGVLLATVISVLLTFA